jgi:mono/diheme cytochrome c family protein
MTVPRFALLCALACGCDNRQAFREPDPTLARMLDQRRADPFEASSAFADGKSMRTPPRGAVARDADRPPPAVTRALLATGRARFERVCGTCHGVGGNGESVVASKMTRRPPPSLHEDRLRALSREQLFAIASRGYGLMPAYEEMLGSDDRWAIVSYVKVLQMSQRAEVAALPADVRSELAKEAP